MGKSLSYYDKQIANLKIGALVYGTQNADWKIIISIEYSSDEERRDNDVITMYNFQFNDQTRFPRYTYVHMIHFHKYEIYYPDKK